jgi:hypothetical protein
MRVEERSSNFEHHKSTVIGERSTLREPVHFAEDQVGNFGGGELMMSFDEFFDAIGSEKLAFAVHGFGNAIGMENDNVAGIEGYAPLVVAGFFKDAERETGEFDFAATTILI